MPSVSNDTDYLALRRLVRSGTAAELYAGWASIVLARMAKPWKKSPGTFDAFDGGHVPYSDFDEGFAVLRPTFRRVGLYVWGGWTGGHARTQYVGITSKSFIHRFGRYVRPSREGWQREINLAEKHGRVLCALADDFCPLEAANTAKYHAAGLPALHPSRVTRYPRAERYAKVGLENLWYYLIPAPPKTPASELRQVEAALVEVANALLFDQWASGDKRTLPMLNKLKPSHRNRFVGPDRESEYDTWLKGGSVDAARQTGPRRAASRTVVKPIRTRSTPSTGTTTAVFPLTLAYPFAEGNGLGTEVIRIREMPIRWRKSYTSTVRRGYVIRLLKQKNLLGAFIEAHWLRGKTEAGRRIIDRCERVAARFDGGT